MVRPPDAARELEAHVELEVHMAGPHGVREQAEIIEHLQSRGQIDCRTGRCDHVRLAIDDGDRGAPLREPERGHHPRGSGAHDEYAAS